MAFRVDLFGDDAPTEIRHIDCRVTAFGTAKQKVQNVLNLYRDEHRCEAGQADLVLADEILGSWIWRDSVCWWESVEGVADKVGSENRHE